MHKQSNTPSRKDAERTKKQREGWQKEKIGPSKNNATQGGSSIVVLRYIIYKTGVRVAMYHHVLYSSRGAKNVATRSVISFFLPIDKLSSTASRAK